jgi:MSHA biogenesis protein MshI
MSTAMRQQINLYQPIFSEDRKQLSAGTVAVFLGVLGIAMAAFSIYTHMQLEGIEAQVAQQRAQQAEREATLAAAGTQSPETDAARITASIHDLEDSIDVRTHALEILKSGGAGATSGFAARLEALARRHVEGVWIDGLTLSGTSVAMTLEGATRDADIVPRYLASLARDPVLSGTRFDDFIIERPGEAQGDDKQRKARKADHLRFRAGSTTLVVPAAEPPT